MQPKNYIKKIIIAIMFLFFSVMPVNAQENPALSYTSTDILEAEILKAKVCHWVLKSEKDCNDSIPTNLSKTFEGFPALHLETFAPVVKTESPKGFKKVVYQCKKFLSNLFQDDDKLIEYALDEKLAEMQEKLNNNEPIY